MEFVFVLCWFLKINCVVFAVYYKIKGSIELFDTPFKYAIE